MHFENRFILLNLSLLCTNLILFIYNNNRPDNGGSNYSHLYEKITCVYEQFLFRARRYV